ncbi:Coiled-coil domain-containing protein 47 [Hypsibius exemplaris]|uniref:PAT complex subunit CCDC47 n=1 Tax=Hypsibius exemplaris TaxID=2072580 RepID=A0A1W0XCY1_HYPEX|nr:Coiled-coil domain-containing protein 47 [Hypsibius exemplaris]
MFIATHSTTHFVLVVILFCAGLHAAVGQSEDESGENAGTVNDFAEFDEDEFMNEPPKKQPSPAPSSNAPPRSDEDTFVAKEAPAGGSAQEEASQDDFEDISVEEADDEDASVELDTDQYDPLEFEGFEEDRPPAGAGRNPPKQQELKIAEVPIVLGRSWEHYFVEYLLIGCLLLYLVWYATGKTTNSKLVQAWLDVHLDLLKAHFSLVGDEGTSKELPTETDESEGGEKALKFIKEADHVYTLWCSGRQYVEGLVVTLKLKKRQDLINSIWRMFRPCPDQMCIRVYMEKEEMDTFVLCLGKKAATSRLSKEMAELGLFCPDRKSGDRFGLPSSMNVLAELGESVAAILDQKVLSVLDKYENEVDYLFFSDQYLPKVDETQKDKQLKRPEPAKILQFCFNLPKDVGSPNDAMERMHPLLLLSLYLVDKVHRYRLSREAKLKAEKNRQSVQEEFLKSTHAQRQEAAQLRREEKRREEKKRIQEEEDPDRQRKLEERDYRKEMKKRGPKVKAVKVKSM